MVTAGAHLPGSRHLLQSTVAATMSVVACEHGASSRAVPAGAGKPISAYCDAYDLVM
jgi:hypothetical protein